MMMPGKKPRKYTLYLCLGVLGALALGSVVYALTPPVSAEGEGPPPSSDTVADSSPRNGLHEAAIAGSVRLAPDSGAAPGQSSGSGRRAAGATGDDDFDQWLQQAYADIDAAFGALENELDSQQMRDLLTEQIIKTEEDMRALEAEQAETLLARDTAVAELEKAAAQADEDLTQAIIDLKIAEQKAPQLLAIGENPYIAIEEAKTRKQEATLRGDEARQAIDKARQDCEGALALLKQRSAVLQGQWNSLHERLSALD